MPPLEGNVWHIEQQNKVFSLYLIQFIHSWTDCPELVFWNSTHGKHSIQQLSVVYLRMQGNNQDKKKDWDALVQWASESSQFSSSNFQLYLSVGQVGKNSKDKHILSLVQKNVLRTYVLNGQVNTNSHLSHRQNN